MSDLLQRGATWLASKRSSALAQTVTYRRGGYSVSLAATKCPPQGNVDGIAVSAILRVDECDWIIQASLLVLGGAQKEPLELDTITEADGAKWQVLAQGDQQAFRPSDPYNTAWRIHTKRID